MSVPPSIRDHVRAGRRARRRGSTGERQVVDILRAFGWVRARRNLARDEKRGQGGGDIIGGPAGVSIEVKLTERLKLREAFAQCSANAGMDTPVVVHRCNRQPWLATLPLEDLLRLLRDDEDGHAG